MSKSAIYNPLEFVNFITQAMLESLDSISTGHEVNALSGVDFLVKVIKNICTANYNPEAAVIPLKPTFEKDRLGVCESNCLVARLLELKLPQRWVLEIADAPGNQVRSTYKLMKARGTSMRRKGGLPIKIKPDASLEYLAHAQSIYLLHEILLQTGADYCQALIAAHVAYSKLCNIGRLTHFASASTVYILKYIPGASELKCKCGIKFPASMPTSSTDDPANCIFCRAKWRARK